jgi:hypothetical protein
MCKPTARRSSVIARTILLPGPVRPDSARERSCTRELNFDCIAMLPQLRSTHAALRLHLSQHTLRAQIRNLETELAWIIHDFAG